MPIIRLLEDMGKQPSTSELPQSIYLGFSHLSSLLVRQRNLRMWRNRIVYRHSLGHPDLDVPAGLELNQMDPEGPPTSAIL